MTEPHAEPILSAVLIVRNEARVLARTLDALSGVVDEIVVADTGSDDDTRQIARRFTDRVTSIPWQDDFAAARNLAIEQASGGWVLSVDADEVIREPVRAREQLRRFVRTHPRGAIGRVEIVSRTRQPDASETVVSSHMQRFFPRRRAEFEGRIHEQLSWKHGTAPRSLDTGVSFDHSGYGQAVDDPSHKAYRNIPLLQAALREEPEEHYYHYQLGRAHFSIARYEQAIDAFETTLGLIDFRTGRYPMAGDKRVARETLTTTVVSLGYSLVNAERLDAAQRLVERHRRLDHEGTHRADFEHLRGYVGLMRGDIDQARAGYLAALKLGSACEDVRGTGSHSSAYHLGLLAEIARDAPAATRHYGQALAFEPDYVPALSRYIDFCVENAFEFDDGVARHFRGETFRSQCAERLRDWSERGAVRPVAVLTALLQRLSGKRPELASGLEVTGSAGKDRICADGR